MPKIHFSQQHTQEISTRGEDMVAGSRSMIIKRLLHSMQEEAERLGRQGHIELDQGAEISQQDVPRDEHG